MRTRQQIIAAIAERLSSGANASRWGRFINGLLGRELLHYAGEVVLAVEEANEVGRKPIDIASAGIADLYSLARSNGVAVQVNIPKVIQVYMPNAAFGGKVAAPFYLQVVAGQQSYYNIGYESTADAWVTLYQGQHVTLMSEPNRATASDKLILSANSAQALPQERSVWMGESSPNVPFIDLGADVLLDSIFVQDMASGEMLSSSSPFRDSLRDSLPLAYRTVTLQDGHQVLMFSRNGGGQYGVGNAKLAIDYINATYEPVSTGVTRGCAVKMWDGVNQTWQTYQATAEQVQIVEQPLSGIEYARQQLIRAIYGIDLSTPERLHEYINGLPTVLDNRVVGRDPQTGTIKVYCKMANSNTGNLLPFPEVSAVCSQYSPAYTFVEVLSGIALRVKAKVRNAAAFTAQQYERAIQAMRQLVQRDRVRFDQRIGAGQLQSAAYEATGVIADVVFTENIEYNGQTTITPRVVIQTYANYYSALKDSVLWGKEGRGVSYRFSSSYLPAMWCPNGFISYMALSSTGRQTLCFTPQMITARVDQEIIWKTSAGAAMVYDTDAADIVGGDDDYIVFIAEDGNNKYMHFSVCDFVADALGAVYTNSNPIKMAKLIISHSFSANNEQLFSNVLYSNYLNVDRLFFLTRNANNYSVYINKYVNGSLQQSTRPVTNNALPILFKDSRETPLMLENNYIVNLYTNRPAGYVADNVVSIYPYLGERPLGIDDSLLRSMYASNPNYQYLGLCFICTRTDKTGNFGLAKFWQSPYTTTSYNNAQYIDIPMVNDGIYFDKKKVYTYQMHVGFYMLWNGQSYLLNPTDGSYTQSNFVENQYGPTGNDSLLAVTQRVAQTEISETNTFMGVRVIGVSPVADPTKLSITYNIYAGGSLDGAAENGNVVKGNTALISATIEQEWASGMKYHQGRKIVAVAPNKPNSVYSASPNSSQYYNLNKRACWNIGVYGTIDSGTVETASDGVFTYLCTQSFNQTTKTAMIPYNYCGLIGAYDTTSNTITITDNTYLQPSTIEVEGTEYVVDDPRVYVDIDVVE